MNCIPNSKFILQHTSPRKNTPTEVKNAPTNESIMTNWHKQKHTIHATICEREKEKERERKNIAERRSAPEGRGKRLREWMNETNSHGMHKIEIDLGVEMCAELREVLFQCFFSEFWLSSDKSLLGTFTDPCCRRTYTVSWNTILSLHVKFDLEDKYQFWITTA